MNEPWVIFGSGAVARAMLAEPTGSDQHVVLAGRNAGALRALSNAYGIPAHLAPLGSSDLDDLLHRAKGVINTAGPYEATAVSLIQSAVRARAHYIDLSNEWRSHLHASFFDMAARKNQVAIVPGSGFGTYACEVLAHHVMQRVADCIELVIVLAGRLSRHTPARRASISAVVAEPALQRVEGAMKAVSDFRTIRRIRLPGIEPRTVVPVSNGNLFALFRTIDLPTIRIYGTAQMPTSLARIAVPVARRLARLHRSTLLDTPRPESELREPTRVIASASSSVASATSILTVEDSNKFSLRTTLRVADLLSGGGFSGSHTAAQILGAQFDGRIPGVEIADL